MSDETILMIGAIICCIGTVSLVAIAGLLIHSIFREGKDDG